MSQATTAIADGTGAQVLAELTSAFSAAQSWQFGSTDPYTAGYNVNAGTWWMDQGNMLAKQRNLTNDAWVVKGKINADGTVYWYDDLGRVISNTYATLASPTFTGTVTAANLTVSGTLTGTATRATSDGDGNNIVNTYLSKSGGTINGSISWTGEKHVYNSNSNIGFWVNDTATGIQDWKNNITAIRYVSSTNTINFGNASTVATFAGPVHAALDSTSTLNGYTAAQLIGTNSHSANGYEKLADGTIIQWVTVLSVQSGEERAITWPIAFTNTCLGGFADANVSAHGDRNTKIYGWTTTGATAYNGENTAANVFVLAIGY